MAIQSGYSKAAAANWETIFKCPDRLRNEELPIVLIDVDGPLADFTEGTRRGLNATWTAADVTAWDFESCPGFDAAAAEAMWKTQGFCANLPIVVGAREGVRELARIAKIYYVTSPMPDAPYWMWERTRWLKANFPDAPIIFASDKSVVHGDYLIDDRPKHLEQWSWGRTVCWDTPCNGHVACYHRVRSWKEIVSLISSRRNHEDGSAVCFSA
jgi:5'(3')-deoxyribonucleotidase